MDQEQKVRERTAVVEARVDIKDLANCAKYFMDAGLQVQSRSDLIWRIVRSMSDTICMDIEGFRSTEEAHGFMYSLGLGSWNRAGRNGRPMNGRKLSEVIAHERRQEAAQEDDFAPDRIREMMAALIKDMEEAKAGQIGPVPISNPPTK